MGGSQPELAVLHEARRRAAALLADIAAKAGEFDRNPPLLSVEKLQEGRQAMNRATDAARRLLENLDRALAEAADDPR